MKALVTALAALVRPRRNRAPGTQVVLGRVPAEPSPYVRRDRLLAKIDEAFDEGGFCVLLGACGAGKTQLAAAYARAAAEASTVVWVAAPADIVLSYAELARRAGVAGCVVDAETAARAALAWLDAADRPVVVVDGATDPDVLNQWLPARARVLITTSVPDFEVLGGTVAVSGFDEAEAAEFLAARSGREDGALGLARELGCLPLALAQASGVVKRRGTGFASYVESLPHASVSLPEREPGCVEDTVLEALRLVVARDGRARGVAEFLALLAPGVRRDRVHRLGPDPVAVDAVLGALAEASLIGFDVGGETVTMHDLTRRAVLGRLHAEDRLAAALDRACAVLDDSDPGLARHVSALWPHFRALLPAEAAPRLARIMRLRRRSVRALTAAGAFAQARALGREVVADHDAYLPPRHPGTERAVRALRRACLASERATEAVTLSERVLERRVRVLGPDAEATLDASEALGIACEGAGLLDRALKVHETNLDHAARVLGPDHRITLRSRASFGRTLRSADLAGVAVPVFEENLREHVRVHGASHPATLAAREDLARTCARAGRAAEAITLHAPDSPWLAVAYQEAGRPGDAIRLLRRLGSERSEDLETVRIRLFLARALLADGQSAEAMSLFERTVRDRTRLLGPDHTATLNARRNLGLAQGPAGRETLTAVAADYRRVLGPAHPYTRQAAKDLAELPEPGRRRRVRR
ncbi:tetratricopeptide repeat protein [Amycolatopsis sp., V23-08]|uniref:Tetratricopeptide repeat protein n=1 Tax=Amycolatopsis heterodermiae TaxID=3110235 RepID=A0ABU5R5B2_9PSEU|nr:tetratricopeptide repeat protein [Amycolatopsis sp., V23-08]MEA5361353.1 tetratricopeptide repeat protein [Amycolatopsis sp., V23-08]